VCYAPGKESIGLKGFDRPNGKSVNVIYLDFVGAFDKVHHKR